MRTSGTEVGKSRGHFVLGKSNGEVEVVVKSIGYSNVRSTSPELKDTFGEVGKSRGHAISVRSDIFAGGSRADITHFATRPLSVVRLRSLIVSNFCACSLRAQFARRFMSKGQSPGDRLILMIAKHGKNATLRKLAHSRMSGAVLE